MLLKIRGIRGPKGVWGGELAMEVGEKSFLSPKARPLFEKKKGECACV